MDGDINEGDQCAAKTDEQLKNVMGGEYWGSKNTEQIDVYTVWLLARR